jgi:hypothetical protein
VGEARDRLFIPIGNDDRAHHDTALLASLRKRSAGEAVLLAKGCGHWNVVQSA